MARRNVIEEILSKRGRHPADRTRIDLFTQRLAQLESTYKELLLRADPQGTIGHPELDRYFPIALTACVEGYFRTAIADLINKGSPFINRVNGLKDVNVSLDAAAAIQTQRITLGEYISHFISLGSLDDINRAISVLLEFDFLERLVTSRFDLFGEGDALCLDSVRGEFVVAIKDLFQTRHMLCHEFVIEVKVDIAQVMKQFVAADVLIGLSEAVIWAEGV